MRVSATALSPKTLIGLAAGFVGLSIVSFLIGVVCLVVGVRVGGRGSKSGSVAADGNTTAAGSEPAAGEETTPAAETEGGANSKPEGGFFSRLRRTATGAFSRGDQPARADFDDGHPVGLYMFTRYWFATGHLEKGVYYFTEDGRVYENLVSGFSEETLAAHKGRHGTAYGKGDNMVVKWADGKETESSVERDKDGFGFGWDMALFAPVTGFEDSSDLVGKWEGGHSLSMSGNYAATSNELDLKADGTFSGASVASFKIESDNSVASVGGSDATRGSWRLDGYQLTLTYQNGKVVSGITFPFDDEKTRRTYFQGTLYKMLP